jgi:diguanylate cyclase (GGDEF)-like protein
MDIDDLKNMAPEELTARLLRAQSDLDLLIRSGRWLVWSATVSGPMEHGPWFDWQFRSDYTQVLPEWFDIERHGDESLAFTLMRARLKEDDGKCNANAYAALMGGAEGYSQEFRVHLRDGRTSWVEENVLVQQLSDDCWHVVGIVVDATARKTAEEQVLQVQEELMSQNDELIDLREKLEAEKNALARANATLSGLATTYSLTGVRNHRAFQEQLNRDWFAAVRHNEPLSLILLDVDRFKEYNDAFGHPAGDDILRTVGSLLREVANESDCVARYGGEEFVLILPQTGLHAAIAIAERLRAGFEQTEWPNRPITASFGVATLTAAMPDARTLIRTADEALYQAKANGRNCVVDAPSLPIPMLPLAANG